MPTKMMVWNIQNFTLNKINTGILADTPCIDVNGVIVNQVPRAADRVGYIVDNIRTFDPDILIVIEVISGRGVKGSLVPGTSIGGQGVVQLHQLLRTEFPAENWNLVPPLKLTDKIVVAEIEDDEGVKNEVLVTEGQYTEAIGVFYKSGKLDFQGPYVWPDTEGDLPNNSPLKVAVENEEGLLTEAYPAPWNYSLPEGNHFAGQYTYTDPQTQEEMLFPGPGSRRPFTTRFVERNSGRIFTIVSVHYPPRKLDAAAANAAIMRYYMQGNYPIAPNEAVMIVGDFNINTIGEFAPTLDDIHLWGFSALLVNKPGGFGVAPVNNATPSMYRRTSNATPGNYINPLGLDNLVWRNGSGMPVPGIQFLVVDRVVTPPWHPLMNPTLPVILQLPQQQGQDVFRLTQNYGKIGPVPGTSDHMAVFYQF